MGRPIAVFALVVASGLAWYLGSPLFLTSRLDEALPGATAGSASAPPATPSPPLADTAPGAPSTASAAPEASVSAATPATQVPPAVRVLASGKLGFVDANHHGEGAVRIVETAGLRILRFENVSISNAPDVRIYLSKDVGGKYVAANTVELGALKATNGSFNYEIPAGTDLGAYRSVVVWCRAFSVLVTWADLAG